MFQKLAIFFSALFGIVFVALQSHASSVSYDAALGLPTGEGWLEYKPSANSFPDYALSNGGDHLLVEDRGNQEQGVFGQTFSGAERDALLTQGFEFSARVGELGPNSGSRPIFSAYFTDTISATTRRVSFLLENTGGLLQLSARGGTDWVDLATGISATSMVDIAMRYDPGATTPLTVSLNGSALDLDLSLDALSPTVVPSWLPENAVVWGTTDNGRAGSFAIEGVAFSTALPVPAPAAAALLLVCASVMARRRAS